MKSRKEVSRRSFLIKTTGLSAVAITAPMILPPGCTAGANERIAVGMIGMGRQAKYANLKAFLDSPDTQVVAVCDVDSWRLNDAGETVDKHYGGRKRSGEYKGCDRYKDFREILGREDIDAVMISTPDHWHVPMAVAAAKARKDICCEKPLTKSIAEGRILSNIVKRNGCIFRTDSEFRSLPVFHRQCELVLNGRIGKIHTIRTGVPKGDVGCEPQPEMPIPKELDYDMWLGPAPVAPYTEKRVHPRHDYSRPGWMRVLDYCDGMVTNWGTHLNDIAQWGNGTERTGPVEVEGRGTYPDRGLWNVLLSFDIQYKYADGVRLFYKIDEPYVRFEGDEGWIHADYRTRELTAEPESILKSEIRDDEIHLPLKSEKADFIEAVKNRGQTLEDAEVGHRTTSLCHLGHIAIQVGKELEWDPDVERFTNSEEANRYLTRWMRSPWSLAEV